METELTIDEMIENLKTNIASLATNLSNPMRFVRDDTNDAIEAHWKAINQLERLERTLSQDPNN